MILPITKDVFPKTILGNIDRTELRRRLEAGQLAGYESRIACVTRRQRGEHERPGNPTEVSIAAIYAELLGLDSAAVGVTTSFFDFGGTSLDVISLKRKLEQRFNICQIATILQNPTVRGLAARITQGRHPKRRKYDPAVAAATQRRQDTWTSPGFVDTEAVPA